MPCTEWIAADGSRQHATGTTAGIERERIYIDYCYSLFSVGDTDESGGSEDRAAYSVAAPNETLIEMGEQERWGGLDADSELVGAFRWRDAKANRLAGTAQAGQFGAYDGSGFVLDVTNLTTSYLVESFEFLEENTWLDRQTRGLFMSVMRETHQLPMGPYVVSAKALS